MGCFGPCFMGLDKQYVQKHCGDATEKSVKYQSSSLWGGLVHVYGVG